MNTYLDACVENPRTVDLGNDMYPMEFWKAEFCKELIGLYESRGGEDSGFMRDQGGKTVGIYDYGTKRRRDYVIEDEAIRKKCMFKIHDRLAPEIRRAYQFNATRMERYIVACYEGEHGGHFRAARGADRVAYQVDGDIRGR